VAAAVRFQLGQEIHHAPELRAATYGSDLLIQLVVECFHHHPVVVNQSNERECRGDLLGVKQLRRVAEVHGHRVVDEYVEVQVFFFEEQFDEKLVEPAVDVPSRNRRSSPTT